MSDDTPTRRLPEPEGEPPTQRLETGTPTTTAAGEDPPDEKKKSRGLLIALIAVGAALVIAIIVLLILLFTSGAGGDPQAAPTSSETASEGPTPSATPTDGGSPTPSAPPSATAAPPPPPPPPTTIVSYTASTTDANCTPADTAKAITFNWNTTGTDVSFGVGTEFADSEPYQTGLPAVGGITIDYQCSNPETKYSIAAFHNGNLLDRATIVVRAD